jgi:hypothetical protein
MARGEVRLHACIFRIGGVDLYVGWHSNDHDSLIRVDNRIASFTSISGLRDYVSTQGLMVVGDGPPVYDWDELLRWCNAPTATGIVPGVFLDAWNMLNDAVGASGNDHLFPIADRRNNKLYDKLFRAANLPAMTQPGEHYEPAWVSSETVALAQIFRLGIAELQRHLTESEL